MRVHAVSDIHVDYPQNLEWVLGLSHEDFVEDVLILAGDVSDDLALLGRVLDACARRFARVLFVPGNHELWVHRGEPRCSLEKFDLIQRLCADSGVDSRPFAVGGLIFAPLFSWYDFSFGPMDRSLRLGWRDFQACRWPDWLEDDAAVAAHFHDLNRAGLAQVAALRASAAAAEEDARVVSCSHFLPSLEVMPGWVPESKRKVYPVLGSSALGRQVRELAPWIHVYGHSHVNQAIRIDGVCYVNNAFATPRETRIASKRLRCLYDSEDGAVVPRLLQQAEDGELWR